MKRIIQVDISGHGMTGKVHACDLFFHRQFIGSTEVFHRRQPEFFPAGLNVIIKKANLPLNILFSILGQIIQHGTGACQHLPAVCPQSVKGTAFNEALKRAPV